MNAPALLETIPPQAVNALGAFGPMDLKQYIQVDTGDETRFSAELEGGQALPQGMICTGDGLVTGIPAKGTEGAYKIMVTASNAAGSVEASFDLQIKPSLATADPSELDHRKAQVWQALSETGALSNLSSLLAMPVTGLDIYYLLERWATLKIWDAFNLDAPGEAVLLNLKGVSEHYSVYDRGSCLVAVPKDLFSHERTLRDGLITARAMASEVYQRGWTVELVGFDRLIRAAWLEIQILGDRHGKPLEVLNFDPSLNDVKLYNTKSKEIGLGGL